MTEPNRSQETKQRGFGLVEVLVVVVAVVLVGLVSTYVWHQTHSSKPDATASSTTVAATKSKPTTLTSSGSDSSQYAGWKTARSPRAGFTLKYPANWTYSEATGANDNVEHIVIDGPAFHITIDSYSGTDPANGGHSGTTCADCLDTLASASLNIPKLGMVDLKTVTYKLDSGKGNAIILQLPNSTYYIPSSNAAEVATSFRGISLLGSESAYQSETQSQFFSNPDYNTAKKILESITY